MIAVTGASGKIGRHVLDLLLQRGHHVVAISTGARPNFESIPRGVVEWRRQDWMDDLEFTPHLQNCEGVIHLGAETWRTERMERVNVLATRALAGAARNARIQSLVFASSVAVYGSPFFQTVGENTALVTADRDVPSEYRGLPSIRAYARSKLLGEAAVMAAAEPMLVSIVRPTVVVDVEDIAKATQLGQVFKALSAFRYTNFIYIKDVASAIVWLLERGFERHRLESVSIYNLSDETTNDQRYTPLFRRIEALSGLEGLAPRLNAPTELYNLADMARCRTFTRRLPLGLLRFPADRLRREGYSHPYSMAHAEKLAAFSLTNNPPG